MDLIPNLSLSVIAYPSIHLFRSGHVITQNPTKSAQQFPCRTEANCRLRTLLPNSSEETFLLPDGFLTELDPQVRPLPYQILVLTVTIHLIYIYIYIYMQETPLFTQSLGKALSLTLFHGW
jgi:hypothetical protein